MEVREQDTDADDCFQRGVWLDLALIHKGNLITHA